MCRQPRILRAGPLQQYNGCLLTVSCLSVAWLKELPHAAIALQMFAGPGVGGRARLAPTAVQPAWHARRGITSPQPHRREDSRQVFRKLQAPPLLALLLKFEHRAVQESECPLRADQPDRDRPGCRLAVRVACLARRGTTATKRAFLRAAIAVRDTTALLLAAWSASFARLAWDGLEHVGVMAPAFCTLASISTHSAANMDMHCACNMF